ncbi:MAG TPA: toll/interleukin-1 receptor domain-containing protein [Anaerolineales bacterium]|nr:toll/interleukin-1 receptor domain-containing protein [Anaerolineales bacterium]
MSSTTPYDFFVSYRHKDPDKTWVRKTLVPALEAKGLRALIDYRDFRLGAPLVTEMARAVEESRFTVAVITSLYIQSNFTELENVMAKQLGLEKSQIRLIGVLRDKDLDINQVRLDIRASLMLDMNDDDEFDVLIERLAGALKDGA